jgi:hypothetical protein
MFLIIHVIDFYKTVEDPAPENKEESPVNNAQNNNKTNT